MSKQTAIISGASSGIGRSLALLLSRRGYNLILLGRNESRLQETASLCKGGVGKIVTLPGDIRSKEYCFQVAQKTLDQFGAIDLLINNAGVGHYHLFSEMPTEAYEEVLGTNLLSVFHLTRAALPSMRERRRGAIVNVSSIGAIAGVSGRTIYCAAKAALRSWSRSLQMEVNEDGVHVLCVLPGSTESNFFDNVLGKPPVKYGSPGKVMSSEEVAGRILSALDAKKREVIIPLIGKALEIANRFSTRLVDWLIKLQLRRLSNRETSL